MTRFPRSVLTPEFVASAVEKRGERFYWRHRTDDYFATAAERDKWNRNFAGRPIAIKRLPNGYLGLCILSHLILIHRLEWVLHCGAWPNGEIDHINGDKTDNRIANLRDGNKSMNMRNQRLRSDSSSGCPGVHWSKSKRRWAARIGIGGKWRHVGWFTEKSEAIAARKRAEALHGFTARHGTAA